MIDGSTSRGNLSTVQYSTCTAHSLMGCLDLGFRLGVSRVAPLSFVQNTGV
jgi:hypothetical protein